MNEKENNDFRREKIGNRKGNGIGGDGKNGKN